MQDPISEARFRSWFDGRSDGRVVAVRKVRGGNPRANYTLPNARLGRRVEAWHQIVVWKRTDGKSGGAAAVRHGGAGAGGGAKPTR